MFFYDEERNSVCAREMAERKDFVVPTFNYELRYDKPPLHYYFMILSYKIFGVNEFASRFFSVLCGACTILITFLFTRKYLNAKTAFYTTLILITSLNLALEFHLAVPDPYLILFMTAAHFAFYDFYIKHNPLSLILMYLALGFAILTKGPLALGLIGLSGLVFLILKRDFNWKRIKSFRLEWGIIIIMTVILPWFISIGLTTNWQWQKNFILDHNLNRLTQEMEGHGGFIGLTILYVFMALLPFSIFIIQAFRFVWRKRKENDLLLFSLVVSVVVVLFFTLSATKLPNYPMPAYPFIGIITGFYLSVVNLKKIKIPFVVYLIFSFILPFVLYFTTQSFSDLSFLKRLTPISLILVIGAVISLIIFIKSANLNKVLFSLAIPWIIVSLLVFSQVFPYVSRQDPVQHALPLMIEEKPVAYYRRCNSAFPWYLRRPIQKLTTLAEINEYIEETPKFYLISAAEYDEELEGLPLKKIFQKKNLFESPVTVVYEELNK